MQHFLFLTGNCLYSKNNFIKDQRESNLNLEALFGSLYFIIVLDSPVFLMRYGYEWSATSGYSRGNRCYFLGIYVMAKYSQSHGGLIK